MRSLRIVLWAAVAVVLFALGATAGGLLDLRALTAGGPAALATVAGSSAPLGGAFALVDNKGRPATEALLRGKPSAVFFGYTHCPDVCPTTLSDMATWIAALGPDAERLRYVFITVDPERDTPAVMDDYVTAFSDRIVGVSGDPVAVHAMVRDYKITARKVEPPAGSPASDYTMDHTASVLLLDAHGSLTGTIAREESRDVALAKLRRLAGLSTEAGIGPKAATPSG